MNEDQRLILDEVLSAPDDDVPRLIYADWLEERGDPRGEFIRVQCELAQTDPLHENYYDLSERNKALLDAHRDQWVAELKQDVRKAEFRRGFIDTITIRARELVKEAEELFRTTPVHWLRLNYVSGTGEQLGALPALRHVRSLDLSNLKIPHAELRALLSSPHLTQLQELDLSYRDALGPEIGRILNEPRIAEMLQSLDIIGQDDANGFVTSFVTGDGFPRLKHLACGVDYGQPSFQSLEGLFVPRLTSLKLRGRLTVNDAVTLCRLPVAELRQLNLNGAGIPATGLRALADSGAFDQIEELHLGNCEVPSSGLRSLFEHGRLSQCREFTFTGMHALMESGRMPEFIQSLAGHEPLTALRQLQLAFLMDAELETLATSEYLQELQSLTVHNVRVPVSGAQAIVQSRLPDSLRWLALQRAGIDSEAMQTLCRREYPNVLWLELNSGWFEERISEESVIHLIESGAFPALRSLELSEMRLTPRTLDALTNRSNCPELRSLNFDGNRANEAGVRSLLASGRLPRLNHLSIRNTSGFRNRPKLQRESAANIVF